jgi:tRNA pseudouridine13 synthase
VDLPYLTHDLAGIGGALRTTDADFFVDEEPAYLPSGTGDHVFVRIEKRNLTTRRATQLIAQALGLPNDRDLGVAGMKDRHAVTRQWISLPPPLTPEAARALAVADVTILEVSRHQNKLRTGHVRANRFVLRVRGVVPGAAERARAILARLAEPPGAPNWYGEQRFGKGGDNAQKGRDLVMGARRMGRDKKLDRLFVSSLQSELFNAWLRARIDDGLYRRVLLGDVLHKRGGGMFTCEDPATDEARLLAGELALTGPMFGDKMRRPPDGSPAAEREAQILAAAGLEAGAFSSVRSLAEGTRRDATIEVRDVTVEAIDDTTIDVGFTLPGGAYATAVMREVMKEPADSTADPGSELPGSSADCES